MVATPVAPAHALYLNELKWGVETHAFVLPVVKEAADATAAHRGDVRRRIAAVEEQQVGAAGPEAGSSLRQWAADLPATCERIMQQFPHRRYGAGAGASATIASDIAEAGGATLPLPKPLAADGERVYRRVLELLRDILETGRWPTTSMARSRVIQDDTEDPEEDKEDKKEDKKEEDPEDKREETKGEAAGFLAKVTSGGAAMSSSTATAAKSGGDDKEDDGDEGKAANGGGSFTVGAMPDGMTAPKANDEFPDLVAAIFDLERHLNVPLGRASSSTCAVNCNAQFKPHRDSGAGAGQHGSLIVGLGDYTGGDLVVENERHDIRYQPLAFDGWSERHWTLPFQGERFSLVWFTPMGCEGKAIY